MSLVPKTTFVRVRVDQDLLDRFRLACDSRRLTVSHVLRQGMLSDVLRFEQTSEYKRVQALGAVSPVIPTADAFEIEKTPSSPVKTLAKGKNREQRRVAAKDSRSEAKFDKKRGA